MRQASLLGSPWQRLLRPFASAFTPPGPRRSLEWLTPPGLNLEGHTSTRSVTAVERLADWKPMVSFAESGAWHADAVTRIPS